MHTLGDKYEITLDKLNLKRETEYIIMAANKKNVHQPIYQNEYR